MNLPHIHEENIQANGRAKLGSKSLKALSRPIQARRRETNPVVSSVGMQGSGLEEYAALPNPVRVMADFGNAAEVFVELAI